MGGLRQVELLRSGGVELAKPTQGLPFEKQIRPPARMQQIADGRPRRWHPILQWQMEASQGRLQHPTGLPIGEGPGFAAAAPEFAAPLAAEHAHQQLHLFGGGLTAQKYPADFKGPKSALRSLEIAAGRLEQFLMQVVAQVAEIRQKRVGQGNPSRGRHHQGRAAGFLQAGGAETPPHPSFHLLCRIQSPGHQGIRKVGRKLVVAHQAGHLLDQVHFPG